MKFPKNRNSLKLSESAIRASNCQDLNIAIIEVDDVCAAERYDFISDLNSILLGKLPRFLLKRNEHFNMLSMETILESQFVDDKVVRKIVSEVNKEWVKSKPLQLIGTNVPGKSFVDKPPKRIFKTNSLLMECQLDFKDEVCNYLMEFCHLLESDELLSFFIDDSLDIVVRKRFDHFRNQLSHSVEKWCEELKYFDLTKVGSLKSLSKRSKPFTSSNFGIKQSYEIDIEKELDEIIKSQFADLHESNLPVKKRKICTQESLNLEDVLSAQITDINKDKNCMGSQKNFLKINLQKEFDVFTEELANICNSKDSQILVDNLYSPIHQMDEGVDDVFGNDISGVNGKREKISKSLSDNESDGHNKFDATIQKSKGMSRSLRKKKLDKEDQQENVPKRHKRKKEDRKHKMKKRKKNKHRDAEKKSRSKDNEPDNRAQTNSMEINNEIPVEKSFQPNPKLYADSYLSCGFDVYQNQKGIDRLFTNFDLDFDPTLAPGTKESPLMNILLDSAGMMEQLAGVIPDVKQFCVDLVNSKNAFLWALSLSTLDPYLSNKLYDENPRKHAIKCTNNPLIQAFRQAVEANKKKDEVKVKVTKSSKKGKHSDKTKSLFKSFGLSDLYKVNCNLKATSRELIRDAFNKFQKVIDNYSRENKFYQEHPTYEIDFTGISPHLHKVSHILSDIYQGAEKKLSSRGKTKLIRHTPLRSVAGMHSLNSYVPYDTTGTTYFNVASAPLSGIQASVAAAYNNSVMYSASASSLAYSGYAYAPYNTIHYPQASWAYQTSYIPGYMPDITSMQTYQGMALQYPTVVSTSTDVVQTQKPIVTTTSGENTAEWPSANTEAAMTDEALQGKVAINKKLNRSPKNTRTYIFKNETPLSKEVEKYLDNIGLKKFDLYNLALLRHLPNFECLIFIHQDDSKMVNQIPGLLRLKRDLRVVFAVYNNFEEVMHKQYSLIFPRAGMVLMDESALIACKSDVLDGLCQFMRKQTYEKGTAWKLLITSSTFKILDQLMYQLEDDIEEHVRITEVSQILQTYKTTGIVEVLTDEFYMSDPKSTADYHSCFLALQKARHDSCRHFLFVTDMPRYHPDSKMFLTNGIDIMNVVEFMRCFVSKTVIHSPKIFESYVTRQTPDKYSDAPISDCAQTISF